MTNQDAKWAQGAKAKIRAADAERVRWMVLATENAQLIAQQNLTISILESKLARLEQRPSPEGLHAQKLRED